MEEDQGSGSGQQDEEKMALILQKQGCVSLARSQFEKLILIKSYHTRQRMDSGSKMFLDMSWFNSAHGIMKKTSEVMWLHGSLYYHERPEVPQQTGCYS